MDQSKKSGPAKPGPGRPPGSKNKLGGQAKENIAAVFNRLGGTANMATWAVENQTEFYRLYARLIPVEQITDMTVRQGAVRDSPEELTPEQWAEKHGARSHKAPETRQ